MRPLALFLSLLLLGCASGPLANNGLPAPSIGRAMNPYANDPNLAAVSVIESPGFPNAAFGFAQRQPIEISFAFWDGRVRQCQFRGDGSMWDSFWWPPNARLKQGSAGWGGFDFAYGSDPTFLRHRDPRLKVTPATTPLPGR